MSAAEALGHVDPAHDLECDEDHDATGNPCPKRARAAAADGHALPEPHPLDAFAPVLARARVVEDLTALANALGALTTGIPCVSLGTSQAALDLIVLAGGGRRTHVYADGQAIDGATVDIGGVEFRASLGMRSATADEIAREQAKAARPEPTVLRVAPPTYRAAILELLRGLARSRPRVLSYFAESERGDVARELDALVTEGLVDCEAGVYLLAPVDPKLQGRP